MKNEFPANTPELSISTPRERVLIVEDDKDVLNFISSLLEEKYEVCHASNGFEALPMFDQKEFDLVVSDILMPIMNGFELLQKLRITKQIWTPFLFLTGLSEKPALIQGLMLGVDSYLTKPFDSDELIARVQNLLSNNYQRKLAFSQQIKESTEHKEEMNTTLPSFKAVWMKELEAIVDKEMANSNFRVPDLAYHMSVSERTFRKRIKEFTGLPPQEYIMEMRMNKALQLLKSKVYPTVAEVAHAVGVEYSSYFSKIFKERFDQAPSEFL